MKCIRAAACLGLAAVAGATSLDAAASAPVNPLTRVVELLENLSKQVTQESKEEEKLFNTFVCWGKTRMNQKAESNALAESRSEELRTYIADLDAGRVEVSSERVDLTKEIEELSGDMEVASQMRTKENKDFEDAKIEMNQALTALSSAIDVLSTATKDHKEGALVALRASSNEGEGLEARQREAVALTRAAALGDKVLTRGDATFLRRLITGEVPVADWKKLNRKATFKQDYKARSSKIQDVLTKLMDTFAAELQEAEKKEGKALALYEQIMTAKGAEKTSAQDALAKMEKEGGAKGMSREQSQQELDNLVLQVTNDKKYIGEVEQALATKTTEWKGRKDLRAGELAAISKAMEILHSDDARDLLARSYQSQQAASLLQLASSSAELRRRTAGAVETLRAAAGHDARLLALVARAQAAAGGHFDEVLAAIEKMLAMLKREEAEDLAKKEQCETNRGADTRQAILLSRGMDELTDTIRADKTKIAELMVEVEQKVQQIAETKKELAEMEANRAIEKQEWTTSNKDDEDAKVLITNTKEVLTKFYADNGLNLMQGAKQGAKAGRQAPGEAPPPPPPTWEGASYGGKTPESQGVVALLDMILLDVGKDITKAKAEEDAAEALFQTSKATMETEIGNLNQAIVEMDGIRGEKEQAVVDNTNDRFGKNGELGTVMSRIKDAAPGCEYFQVNYLLRASNRQVEVEGLIKAKQILSGGEFATPKDPSREIKPGDALVQRRKFLGRAAVL